MFKHFLLPTDGSESSEATIQQGMQLARSVRAKVTGFYVMPRFHVFTYHTEMLEDNPEEYARDCKAHADKFLAVIEKAARDAGVECDTEIATSDHTYEAIIKAAQDHDCDLIMMASHGRGGVQGLLLGSETQKVLTHSKVPVLVYR